MPNLKNIPITYLTFQSVSNKTDLIICFNPEITFLMYTIFVLINV